LKGEISGKEALIPGRNDDEVGRRVSGCVPDEYVEAVRVWALFAVSASGLCSESGEEDSEDGSQVMTRKCKE
jgi:hypothetical protein